MFDKSYKQIVILSGKGGTGKTTFSSSLAAILNNKIVIDCDVDAANLFLILKHEVISTFDYYGGKKALINQTKCTECGLCQGLCSFDAISNFTVDQLSCEGCGFCYRICPFEAVIFKQIVSGKYYECLLPDNSKFYYAKLYAGEGNSGKLVSELKRKALENIPPEIEWVIVDGPPGVGCPVNASAAAADYVVIVTEPTLSGVHDLKRLTELLNTFKINAGIVINKYDLNMDLTSQIFKYAGNNGLPVIGTIPFDKEFMNALINGENIVEVNENIREIMYSIRNQIEQQLELAFN
ncbi:MAG: ATP-binding protein [Bacteroidetes bacterium]|nr:ATP-binding protein [Bacteroidota bacterium]